MKIFSFFSKNLLFILSLFLLAFIPLYPKLPIVGVNHTWVYIRLEDFIVAFSVIVLLIKLISKKIFPRNPLTIPILVFWLVGAISTVYAIYFIFPHIANVFPNVAIFNYLRRIEYLSLFFVGFYAIRNKKDVLYITLTLSVVLVLVVLYGLGQRYLGFPAFLTMNEEFAKGTPLRLSPLARIPSTFAGHYDLAAYLVMLIPIIGSMIFGLKKWFVKIFLVIVSLAGLTLLLMTASRVSFFVYLFSICFLLIIQKQKKYIIPVLVFSILYLNLFQGISQRFTSTISQVDVVVDARTGKPVGIVQNTEKDKKKAIVEEKQSTGESLPKGTGFINLPVEPTEKTITQVVYKRTKINAGTESAEITNIEGSFVIKKALAYDMSFTTRFQGEWPRAIDAFKRNILLGSGYSSISLATDNNYLRILGEVGILGFLSFITIFLIIAFYLNKVLENIEKGHVRSFALGVAAGIFALGLNAFLIDVFEASKVAFVLWLLLGLMFGLLNLFKIKKINYLNEFKRLLISPPALIIYLFVFALLFFSMMLNNYFVGDDFTWLRWAGDCPKVMIANGSLQCESTKSTLLNYFTKSDGFFYRPGTKIYFYFMYAFFWLNPQIYHFGSLFFHFLSTALVFLISFKLLKNKFSAFVISFLFLILGAHSEAVFWISATGHVISSSLILFSLLFYIYWIEKKHIAYFIFSLISALSSLFFYELGLVTPLIIFAYFLIYKKSFGNLSITKKILNFCYLVPLPFYFYIRYFSNSHWLSGDYSYRLSNLPYNILGNLFGYAGISFIGSRWIPFYESLRLFGKQNHLYVLGFLIIFLILIYLAYRFILLNSSYNKKIILFSTSFFIIVLLPFLGFGNIAIRYVYLASFGALLLFVLALQKLYVSFSKLNNYLALLFLLIIFFAFSLFQWKELVKVNQDWQRAGEISNKLLVGFNDTYAKTKAATYNPVFYFVNVPIKTGEAWIFPVGLPDAMWFTFQNEFLTVHISDSLGSAFDQAEGSSSAKIFEFDKNGNVEEITRTKNTIKVPIKK